MQEILKRMLADLNAAYFKPNGFKRQRQRFRRESDTVVQEVEFQSSQWNSSDGPVTFYVNVSVGFTDLSTPRNKLALTGTGRIAGLASEAPPQFDLSPVSYDEIRGQLLELLLQALSELPNHYEDVRVRALAGLRTPIPLPETWRT